MTPLAHWITRNLIETKVPEPLKTTATTALAGAHFFETTEALPLVDEVQKAWQKSSDNGPFMPCTFLPAPKTWVEWREAGKRHAVCLIDGALTANITKSDEVPLPGTTAQILYFSREGGGAIGAIDLKTAEAYTRDAGTKADEEAAATRKYAVRRVMHLLAIINSPRVVMRRTHSPHKKLSRELARRPDLDIGPLHDWHEIKLEISKPRHVDDGEPHTDVITGKRALHFCRKHLRLWNGRLIPVREHWRGDPSIGIRRGRYVVTA